MMFDRDACLGERMLAQQFRYCPHPLLGRLAALVSEVEFSRAFRVGVEGKQEGRNLVPLAVRPLFIPRENRVYKMRGAAVIAGRARIGFAAAKNLNGRGVNGDRTL